MKKNKKKYIFKKSDAVRRSDPMAYFHQQDDDKIHAAALEESMSNEGDKKND